MSAPIVRIPLGLGVELIERRVYEDKRGSFTELWNSEQFQLQGLSFTVQQTSVSRTNAGVLRGLHFQSPAQAKLLTLLEGRTFHVAVDLRPDSASFSEHISTELTASSSHSLFIPEGFAHGLLALEPAILCYQISRVHQPDSEWSVRWDDEDIGIEWPISGPVVLSERDEQAYSLKELPPLALQGLRSPSRADRQLK